MKLFFLIRALTYGGAERQLTVLSKGLQERGHEVMIAVFYAGGPLEEELRGTQVRIVNLKKRGRWDVFGFVFRLIVAVRRAHPDVIHGYLSDANLLSVMLKPLFPQIKTVWGIRSSDRDLHQETWLERVSLRLNAALSRFPDAIIANSQGGRDHCMTHGYPKEKMMVIPNGVDTDRFRPDREGGRRIREQWGLTGQHYIIGMVGRLSPVKDHPNFLRAAALLAKARRDIRFVCIGDGSTDYRLQLHSLSDRLGLKECVIWSAVCEDMPAVYNALDLLVSSSSSEGLSNVIGEGMACGVRCVVTNVGDSAWLVGDKGEVVPPKDPIALKNGIQRAMNQTAYGSAQIRREIVERLSVRKLITHTEHILTREVMHLMNEDRVIDAAPTVGSSIKIVMK